jgi:hypothetical protein
MQQFFIRSRQLSSYDCQEIPRIFFFIETGPGGGGGEEKRRNQYNEFSRHGMINIKTTST